MFHREFLLLARRPSHAQMAALEQRLLGHFQPSGEYLRRLSPLSWQLESTYDAEAISREVLFPISEREAASPGGGSPATSSQSSKAATPVFASGHEKSETPASRLLSGPSEAFAAIEKDRILHEAFSEFMLFREIGPRSTTMVDSNSKHPAVEEVGFDTVDRDIREGLWEAQIVPAFQVLYALAHKPKSSPPPPPPCPQRQHQKRLSTLRTAPEDALEAHCHVPNEVIFLVAVCQRTKESAASCALERITRRTQALIQRSPLPSCFPLERDLAVVPILIGAGHADGQSSTGTPELCYPYGGIYTTNTALQCLQGLPSFVPLLPCWDREDRAPSQVKASPSSSRVASRMQVKRTVLILSDAFLHARLMADMHGRHPQLPLLSADRSTPTQVADGSFSLKVFPAIVGDALSDKEEEAFARYAVCQLFSSV